jgi:hypothetical protein
MAKGFENTVVRDAQVAAKLLAGKSRTAVQQGLIGPGRVAEISERRLFGERHGKSIYGVAPWF